jgi:hypothetical protein
MDDPILGDFDLFMALELEKKGKSEREDPGEEGGGVTRSCFISKSSVKGPVKPELVLGREGSDTGDKLDNDGNDNVDDECLMPKGVGVRSPEWDMLCCNIFAIVGVDVADADAATPEPLEAALSLRYSLEESWLPASPWPELG